jgi:hypothetical protein
VRQPGPHRSQIKKPAPVRDAVITRFCAERYFRFLSRRRTAAEWDALEALVREGGHDEDADWQELTDCGIMVWPCGRLCAEYHRLRRGCVHSTACMPCVDCRLDCYPATSFGVWLPKRLHTRWLRRPCVCAH